MKISLILTVRNEDRLLKKNLLYHHTIGVDKVYVYFDKTSDNGKESIMDLDFVEISDSVPVSEFQQHSYLEKFTGLAGEHHTARQCLNIYDASVKAENEGFDWLISLDADELLCTETNKISDLKVFFSHIEDHFDAVRFSVREVLQAKKYYQNVYSEETRFKTQRSFKRYFQNIYKKIYNPLTGEYEKYIYWYGHHAGKMAIRLNRGLIPLNVHRFTDQKGKKPETRLKGLLLHYHSYDTSDFIKKYKNFESHPDTYLSGRKIENLKMLLIKVVNHCGLTDSQLEEYFENNLMYNEKEIKKLWYNRYFRIFRRDKPALTEITAVQKTFNKIRERCL